MEYSLLKEINKKTLQAYLIARQYEKLYWPLFFPLKVTPFLTYETLIGSKGNRVAADVVSYNSSAPEKTRKVVSKLVGDIPPIRMKRVMKETDINTYNILKAQANPDQKAILSLVFDDVDACVDGINGRLEWLTLQALSQGKITLTKSNNAGIITENAINFQLPAANKEVVADANHYWNVPATATPIANIQTIVTEANSKGVKLQYILMDLTKWQQFRATTEVKDFVAPYMVYGGVRAKRAPTLEVANSTLKGEGLPVIVIIDTYVDIETDVHVITATNPWTTKYVTFIPEMKIGDMFYGPIAEETNPPKQVVQAKKGPILISKYSEVDPVTEFTKGELNAFPSWPTIDRCWILNTMHHITF